MSCRAAEPTCRAHAYSNVTLVQPCCATPGLLMRLSCSKPAQITVILRNMFSPEEFVENPGG